MTKKRPLKLVYKNHPSLLLNECVYCGQHATTIDHIPALTKVQYYPESEKIAVRACSICNSILSNVGLIDISSRVRFLFSKYPIRFKKLLEMPPWDEEELSQLSGKLKLSVMRELKKKRMIENKMIFLQNLLISFTNAIIK